MNRHLVATVGVGGDAEVPATVFPAGTDEAEDTYSTVGGVVLLQSITIVGKFRL